MDGTETNVDITSQESTETSKTITEEQAVERERQARSDTLAEAGRIKAEGERALKAANEAATRFKEIEERAYQADRARYKDEPEKLSALEVNRREGAIKAELDEANRKLSEETVKRESAERLNLESQRKETARVVASRLNVDPTLLSELSILTDGSVEAIEAKAKMLTPTSPPNPVLVNNTKSANTGTGHKPTLEELQASDPFETDKRVQSGEWVL